MGEIVPEDSKIEPLDHADSDSGRYLDRLYSSIHSQRLLQEPDRIQTRTRRLQRLDEVSKGRALFEHLSFEPFEESDPGSNEACQDDGSARKDPLGGA